GQERWERGEERVVAAARAPAHLLVGAEVLRGPRAVAVPVAAVLAQYRGLSSCWDGTQFVGATSGTLPPEMAVLAPVASASTLSSGRPPSPSSGRRRNLLSNSRSFMRPPAPQPPPPPRPRAAGSRGRGCSRSRRRGTATGR